MRSVGPALGPPVRGMEGPAQAAHCSRQPQSQRATSRPESRLGWANSRVIAFPAPEGAGQPGSGCHLKPATARWARPKLCPTPSFPPGQGGSKA